MVCLFLTSAPPSPPLLRPISSSPSPSPLLPTFTDINAKSTLGGNTALHRAAENGNPGAIRTLLRRGIDYNAKNFFGNTALHIAAKKVLTNILKILTRTW